MATKTTVAVEIDVDSNKGQAAVGSFKKQLKEATAELVNMSMKFGETSAEAQNAAKKVAGLKDAIGDAKALADTFNPDKKFVALGGALQGATAGFSALQGAMGLFGSDSEELNKTLLKVQSAMALQQGISGVFGAIDSFKLLRAEVMQFTIVQKIVTGAQYLWNAAMAANPIGAIVAVVAALVAGIVALTAWLIKSSDAAKQNAAQIKESAKALEEQKKSADRAADALKRNTDYTLEMLKASGATTAEIRNAERALAAKAVVEARTTFQVAAHTREIESQRLAQMKANGATDENIKAQMENLNKYTENLNEQAKRFTTAKQAELDLIAKQNVQITQEQTDANKKAAEKRQEDVDNAKKKAEEIAKANEDADKQILNAKQQNTLAMIADENDRAKIAADYDLQNKTDEINRLNITNERKKELIRLAEEANALTIKGINEKIAEDKAKNDADKEIRKKEKSDKEIAEAKRVADEKAKVEKEAADKAIQLEKDIADQKKAVQDATFNALGAGVNFLQAIAGKNKGLQKAAAIAEGALGIAKIVTATNAANALALATPQAVATSGAAAIPVITANKIGAAFGIASTIAATAKAIQAIGGGGSAPGPTNVGGGGGGVNAPLIPQAQTTRLDQTQVNQIGNAAARAYVVESDITNGQERINRLNRAAQIN